MVRVGGGFATIENHLKQVGPIECVKIYKIMKGSATMKAMSFRDTILYYLKKCYASSRIVKEFKETDCGE